MLFVLIEGVANTSRHYWRLLHELQHDKLQKRVQSKERKGNQISPVYDALAAQVPKGQGQFTDVEFDSALREVDVLLEVIAQVSSQEQVHHHKHVLLILEGIPAGEGSQE